MADPARFTPVPVVGRSPDQGAATLLAELEAWTTSEPLAALVAEFDGHLPDLALAERLAWLDTFSKEWDYRAKATRAARSGAAVERNQTVDVTFDDARSSLVMGAVSALGLVVPNFPRYDSYDHVLVNGALVRYSIWRMAYAGHLVRGGLRTRTLAALTAYRAMARNSVDLEADEPTLLARYGLPGVANEAEMMEFLLQREFGLGDLTDVVDATTGEHAARFTVRTTAHDDVEFAFVAAPDPTSAARANTGDTMRFWAREVVDLKPGDRVLSISSSIYGPFQHAAALQHLSLPFRAEVDTVAIDFDAIPPEPAPYVFPPSRYLQEVRSTIRSYHALHGTLQALDAGA